MYQCEVSGVPAKKLVVDVNTQWNSTFLMIQHALELREPLESTVASDHELCGCGLTDDEWNLLIIVSKLLDLFKQSTDFLCASTYPTLAITIPVCKLLIDKIEGFKDKYKSKVVNNAIEAAITKLKPYYARSSAATYFISTILDPRLKFQYYHAHNWEPQWIDTAKTFVEGVYHSYIHLIQDKEQVEHEDLITHIFQQCIVKPKDELTHYLATPPADRQTDVLQWWKLHAQEYPHLAAMARDYLAISATSAPIERVFSGADLLQDKHGLLDEDTIGVCLCLQSWLKSS